MFGLFKKKTEVQQAIDSMGFEEASHHYAAMVASKIPTVGVMHQFYMEELDAASQGNALARSFVEDSGVLEQDYKGALDRSNPNVDGPDGPQQLLLRICMQLAHDEDLMVRFRLQIVTNLVEQMEVDAPSSTFRVTNEVEMERFIAAVGPQQAGLEMRKRAMEGDAYCQEALSQLATVLIQQGKGNAQVLGDQYLFTKLSAESGNPSSQYNLAKIYTNRIDTKAHFWSPEDHSNMRSALMWHERAFANGVAESESSINTLKKILSAQT
ncbi:hypothetical protein D7Y40_03105 [Stenotrophomonas maltophilia]|uniref:hypothetical protein n=1 Tax=Stenotrophomonas maltophilia TaxID=40324 RepID=UPI0015DEE8BA|nr:hypothetical protein [Stenotrophomonas maltophilia]MBA0335390.1 hypothetical protein [Stenotrophomonas maltophilia]MBA0542991.1 hypothetical protein [Stenotrophomonas maltophilia]